MNQTHFATVMILFLATLPAAGADLPLLVGGHAHGATNIQALSDLGLGNFVWIPKLKYGMGNTPWDLDPSGPNGIYADVEACLRNGLYFAISQRRGLGTIWRPGGFEYGGDCWGGDLHSPSVIAEIALRAGGRFVGLHAEELDCDFLQNAIRPGYRSRVAHLYDFTDRAGGRLYFEEELARIGRLYHGYGPGVQYWPNLAVSLHHSGFRAGADLVFAEFLESLPTTELQLAYLRGGSRQFGKDWGMWVSPWHGGTVPCEDKGLWPAGPAVIGGGHPASAFRRCLYLAYVSGARVLTLQETEPLFSRAEPGNPQAGYTLAAWGKELKEFWEYVRHHSERVEPIVPFALLVDRDNGWAPGNLHGGWIERETVWGKLLPDRSDAMLSSYLDLLIPGYGRKTPDWWAKNEMYPGYFAATPYGAFDIVASDIGVEQLAVYPAVVLMGDMQMTGALLNVLRAYVEQGGNLYVNVHQMRLHEDFVQDTALLGATIGGSLIESDWAGGTIIGRRIFSSQRVRVRYRIAGLSRDAYDEPPYALQDVQTETAEVLADDGNGNPVLLRNRYGKGYAWLSTPEYMLEGWGDRYRPLNFFADLLHGLLRSGPVAVTQLGDERAADDISWIAARRGPQEVLVLLVNHGRNEREADVHWRASVRHASIQAGGGRLVNVQEVDSGAVFRVTVPPEDVALLGIH